VAWNDGLGDYSTAGCRHMGLWKSAVFMWRGESSGVSLMRTNFKQLRGALPDACYITEQEFDQDSARLDDPDFMGAFPHHSARVKTSTPLAITYQCAYTITHPGPLTLNGSSIPTQVSVGRL
jgi:hypothetical protein